MANLPRITNEREFYLIFIEANPGCSTADLDRSCRTARAGHHWMYAAVSRMQRAGLVERGPAREGSAKGGAFGLYLTDVGQEALDRKRGYTTGALASRVSAASEVAR